jgi:hypothetical protein
MLFPEKNDPIGKSSVIDDTWRKVKLMRVLHLHFCKTKAFSACVCALAHGRINRKKRMAAKT